MVTFEVLPLGVAGMAVVLQQAYDTLLSCLYSATNVSAEWQAHELNCQILGMMTALMASPEKEVQNCFEGWTGHWCQCRASQGEYFEADCNDIQQ